jgi:hypothetical protein
MMALRALIAIFPTKQDRRYRSRFSGINPDERFLLAKRRGFVQFAIRIPRQIYAGLASYASLIFRG